MAYTYNSNRTGDATVEQEGKRLISAVPMLQKLKKNNIISADHKFNSISAHRSIDEQKSFAVNGTPRYTSGAYKFAMVNKGAPPAESIIVFHGNINGEGIL